jgi:translation initiation factor 2D
MAIAELWRPSGAAVDFWGECGIDKDTLSLPSIIKPTVDAFLEKNRLVDASDRRIVKLNKVLASAVKAKDGDKLHRDEVVRRLRAGVVWSVSVGGVVK